MKNSTNFPLIGLSAKIILNWGWKSTLYHQRANLWQAGQCATEFKNQENVVQVMVIWKVSKYLFSFKCHKKSSLQFELFTLSHSELVVFPFIKSSNYVLVRVFEIFSPHLKCLLATYSCQYLIVISPLRNGTEIREQKQPSVENQRSNSSLVRPSKQHREDHQWTDARHGKSTEWNRWAELKTWP